MIFDELVYWVVGIEVLGNETPIDTSNFKLPVTFYPFTYYPPPNNQKPITIITANYPIPHYLYSPCFETSNGAS